MDVFDLIGGERSDVSDWDDEETTDGDDHSDDGAPAPEFEKTPGLSAGRTTGRGDVPGGHSAPAAANRGRPFPAATVAATGPGVGVELPTGPGVGAELPTGATETGGGKGPEAAAAVAAAAAEAAPRSKEGDALNLFTINPVSKEDAKDYPPLLGLLGDAAAAASAPASLEAAPTASVGSETEAAAARAASTPVPRPRRAYLPFLATHPELDVLVVDGVLTEMECARIVATAEASAGFSFWDARPQARRDYRDADTIEAFDSAFAELLWRRLRPFFLEADAGRTKEGGSDSGSNGSASDCGGRRGDGSSSSSSSRSSSSCGSSRSRATNAGTIYNNTPGTRMIEIPKNEDLESCRWQRDLVGKWAPVGTNDNLLVARYHPHGHFAPHTDGYSIVDFNRRSMYSIVVYLNTIPAGCGGGTRFYSDTQKGCLEFDPVQKRYVGQPEHELGTVDPVCGRVAMFFHNHMHEGVPPVHGYSKYIIRSDVMYARTPPICTSAADREAFKLYQRANGLSGPGSELEAMQLFQRCFAMSPGLADVYGM